MSPPSLIRVLAFGPGNVVAQIEREIGAVLEEAVVEADVRANPATLNEIARNDTVRISLRKPLPRRISKGGPDTVESGFPLPGPAGWGSACRYMASSPHDCGEHRPEYSGDDAGRKMCVQPVARPSSEKQ